MGDKMHSFAPMNGQYQQVGPPQQAPQAASLLAHNATRNQNWSTEEAYQYVQTKSGVQLLQNGNAALHNGAYLNRHTANLQNSAGPNQALNSQQKSTKRMDNHFLRMLLRHLPNPPTTSQSGNSSLLTTHGSPTTTQQNFRHNSANQSPINTNPQQQMSACWNQSVSVNDRQPIDVQSGNTVPFPQQNVIQQAHYASESLKRVVSGYTTATASLPHEQVFNPSTFVTTAAHNGKPVQTAYNKFSRQNSTDCSFPPNYPPSCLMATSQSFGNNSMTIQPSNAQSLYFSNASHKTQQHTAQLSSPYNTWGNVTNSSNTKSVNFFENPTVAPQQMLRHRVSPDSLGKSNTAGFDEHIPPSYNGKHFVTIPRVSTQNMQPVTSVSFKNCNLNTSQSPQLPSGQSLPQSIMSRVQHPINMPPPQNSFPDTLGVTTATDASGRGKADNVFLPNSNMTSKGSPVGSLNSSSQLQAPVSVSSQRKELKSFAEKHPFPHGLPPSFKQNDGFAHSTPGHPGPKAVAVVQPLSQEHCQTSSNSTSCESASNAEKECISPDVAKNKDKACFREESNLYLENSNQTKSKRAMSNDGPVLLASDSEHLNSTRKSGQDINTAPTVQKASEVPASQSCPKRQNKNVTPPSPPALDLNSLPTTPWTAEALTNLILDNEKVQSKAKKGVLGKNRTLLDGSNLNCQKDLLSHVEKFCSTHITPDTVILSKVKLGFSDQLKHFHILKDGEVYSELPYKSSWLNVNDQLDDIDKEFGFPWALKQRQYMLETDNQMDGVKTGNSAAEPIANEVPNKVLSQTEPESVNLIEEKKQSVKTPSTPLASPNKSERDNSIDSPYSFKIQILPPEEAKVLYDQVQKKMHQSTVCEEETVASSSVQSEKSKGIDDSLKELIGSTRPADQIDQICCIARLVELNFGPTTPALKCLCQKEQSFTECTDTTVSPESDEPTESKQDIDCQIITLGGPELCSELCQIIDLTDNEDKLNSDSDQEPKAISEICNSSQSDVVSISDKENENLSNSEYGFPNEMPDLVIDMTESEDKCAEEKLKSTETLQLSTSASSGKQTEIPNVYSTETEVGPQMSDQKEDCGQAHLKSKDKAESTLETREETQIGGKTTHQASSGHYDKHKNLGKIWKRQKSLNDFFPPLKDSKKCKLPVELDSKQLPKAQHSTTGGKTVELVLFGTPKQAKSAVSGNRMRHCSSPTSLSSEKNWPPEVLSVNLDSWKSDSTKAAPTRGYSVKQLIYEKWRKSVPTESFSVVGRHRNKLKMQRQLSVPLSGGSLRREKQSVSSEMRAFDASSKSHLRLNKRNFLSNRLRVGEGKRRRYSVMVEKIVDQERSDTQNESQGAMPLQENIVLKFSVLPNTFDFKDGSRGRNETADAATDKPELVEEKDQTSNKDVIQSKGTWYPPPEKQHQPTCIPRTISLFHEYQKMYKEKNPSSTDE
ncbi:uncharacterized protein [Leuresthes tenuis]|uniref:uncharacterized protein n=1 Tax=Leuresthes tenuis TaxID=355514 RepID=UPI003B502E2C